MYLNNDSCGFFSDKHFRLPLVNQQTCDHSCGWWPLLSRLNFPHSLFSSLSLLQAVTQDEDTAHISPGGCLTCAGCPPASEHQHQAVHRQPGAGQRGPGLWSGCRGRGDWLRSDQWSRQLQPLWKEKETVSPEQRLKILPWWGRK